MSAEMTGKLLSNRYLIGERIGVGGMAEVYQGQDTVLGRVVAVKVMLPQYAEDPAFTARFRQEAAAAANLQSPYIVNVYDWGQDAQTPFIVMEFVRGSDLKTAIKERGSVNQRKVAEIGSQVCQALSVAHRLDIVHRDIKPQNIMVQPDGNVKVMDFGIARAKNTLMDKTDVVLGTAHYISPEQAQGKDLSPASDIYSLGVVLYEAVTGKLPFDGPDAVSVAMKQVNEQPAPPSEVLPSINPDLEAIILKAMSKSPDGRFATAMDMRMALNDYLHGRPVNLDGLSAAQTSVLTESVTEVVSLSDAQHAGDHTSVMSPTEVNGAVRQTVRPANYRDSGKRGGGGGKDGNGKGRSGGSGSSRRRGPIIALAAIVAVAAVALIAFSLLGNTWGRPMIDVPDVTGQTLEEATAAIEDAGFNLGQVDYKFDESIPENTVISQTPRQNTKQEKGSKISLTISQGIEQVTVPNLKNMSQSEARAALQKEDLKFEIGEAESSDDVAENRVASQSPAALTKVAKGSSVTVHLSSGKEKTDVPDVTNSLEGTATATLQNAGFKVKVDYQNSSTVAEGMVISQTPNGGQQAAKDSTVSIVVSSGAKYYVASAYVSGAADGGSVSPTYADVAEGNSVTFYISTNSGYKIASVTDSNGNSYGASSSVVINNVRGDISLNVTFEKVAAPSTDKPTGSGSSEGKKS